MTHAHKVIENPDSDSPRRSDRKLEMLDWNKEQGIRIAREEGIKLTDEHWEVIYCLRDYYLEHGPVKNGREIGDMLNKEFGDQGGRKYLRRLFPEGPVAQGMHIAGLRIPPYTEDAGFGTRR